MMRGMRSAARYIWIIVFIAFVGGFLVLDTSGLLSTNALTPSTRVAKVNGRDILYGDWQARLQNALQQQSRQQNRATTLDETRDLENRLLEEMIMEILLDEEYRRRGITVTREEILSAAQVSPHPDLLRSPELQTDGQFDLDKYYRFLKSPSTKDVGWLDIIEDYYRTEIPRRKLLEQIVADVYVTDEEMWNKWRETHDSAQASFVALTAAAGDSIDVSVSEAEIRSYYNNNEDLFRQPGRAQISLIHLSKIITPADSAAARERLLALRTEIAAGNDSTFAEVARRESDDLRSSSAGGELPKGVKGQFFGPAFDSAAFALRPGQLSQPILTAFGYHLIQLKEKTGDTLTLRHVLAEVRQNDSAAVALDRRADSLTSIAGSKLDPASFDQAATTLGVKITTALVFSGQPLVSDGKYVPSVSAWAFSGAREGENSEVFDADEGFWMARLDSLTEDGVPPLDDLRPVIQQRLENTKKLQALMPKAEQIAQRAAATSLEAAAAQFGTSVQNSQMFTRITFVNGMGRDNEAIGAVFALPVGSVSAPVLTEDAIFVLRPDRKVLADREAWAKQKNAQRISLIQSLRQDRAQSYLRGLRESATVVDERKKLAALGRDVPT